MSSSPEPDDCLPKTNVFAGESFGLPNVRTIYVKAEEDSKRRRPRVLLLIGSNGAGKSTLIDFMCNYFYGAELEKEERFKIANEKFDGSTPNKSIITYIFNESKMDFLPIVIDTPGFSFTADAGVDDHLLFSWLRDNCNHRIDGIGVVFSAVARMTSVEENGLTKVLDHFPSHMRDHIYALTTRSDGSPVNIPLMRRFNLHNAPAFKFNNSCLYKQKQDDSLKEYLRDNYWRMTEKNLTALFDKLKEGKPVNFSGGPIDDSHFHWSDRDRSLDSDRTIDGDKTIDSSINTTTTTRVEETTVKKDFLSDISTRRTEEYKPPPVPTVPSHAVPLPPPPPHIDHTTHTAWIDESETSSISYETTTFESSTTTGKEEHFHSEHIHTKPPTPPPASLKKNAHESFSRSTETSPTTNVTRHSYTETFGRSDLGKSTMERDLIEESTYYNPYQPTIVRESIQTNAPLDRVMTEFSGSETFTSDSSQATVINTRQTNANDKRTLPAFGDTHSTREMESSSSSCSPSSTPPRGSPLLKPFNRGGTYHTSSTMEEKRPSSRSEQIVTTTTTTYNYGTSSKDNDHRYSQTSLLDQLHSPRYDLPPTSHHSTKYENIGYGVTPGNTSARLAGTLSETDVTKQSVLASSDESPLNDGIVRYVYDERTRTHRAHVVSRGSSRGSTEEAIQWRTNSVMGTRTANAERESGVYAYGTLPRTEQVTIQGASDTHTLGRNTGTVMQRETIIGDPAPVGSRKSRETLIDFATPGDGVAHGDSSSFTRNSTTRLSRHRLSEHLSEQQHEAAMQQEKLNQEEALRKQEQQRQQELFLQQQERQRQLDLQRQQEQNRHQEMLRIEQEQQQSMQRQQQEQQRIQQEQQERAAQQQQQQLIEQQRREAEQQRLQQQEQQRIFQENQMALQRQQQEQQLLAVQQQQLLEQQRMEAERLRIQQQTEQQRLSQMYAKIDKPPLVPKHGGRYENISMTGINTDQDSGDAAERTVEEEMLHRESMLRQTTHDVKRDSYMERMAPTVYRTRPQPTPRRISGEGSHPTSPQDANGASSGAQNTVMIPRELRAPNSPITYRIEMGQKQRQEAGTNGYAGVHQRTEERLVNGNGAHLARAEEEESDEWDRSDNEQQRRAVQTQQTVQTRSDYAREMEAQAAMAHRQAQQQRYGEERAHLIIDKERHELELANGQRNGWTNPRDKNKANKRIRNRTSYFGAEYPHWKIKYFLSERASGSEEEVFRPSICPVQLPDTPGLFPEHSLLRHRSIVPDSNSYRDNRSGLHLNRHSLPVCDQFDEFSPHCNYPTKLMIALIEYTPSPNHFQSINRQSVSSFTYPPPYTDNQPNRNNYLETTV